MLEEELAAQRKLTKVIESTKIQPKDLEEQIPLNEGLPITKEDLSNGIVDTMRKLTTSLKELAWAEDVAKVTRMFDEQDYNCLAIVNPCRELAGRPNDQQLCNHFGWLCYAKAQCQEWTKVIKDEKDRVHM